ncbi:MAG: AmpG family muropeptide MFS transporter [Deltaproteobacteria bacterium]|nr:MAG: AmpG family muropeptide MFS transporter [Deltaproteobacteria bacterium]
MIAIPDWMASTGVSISMVGLITLAQAPWAFTVLWSPFMDRYPRPWLGRRRGWAAVAQVTLFALTLLLAGVGHRPETPWVVAALALAIAFAGASQDIADDAYAVDVLRPEEQGAAVGARIALYRAALFVSGGLSITLAAAWSWPVVNACLAVAYLAAVGVTWGAPAPEPERPLPPPATLRGAVWQPFLGLLARHRALEILAFVVFYKFSDQLAQSLIRPFLGRMGYSAFDRGFALATVGLGATLLGTFLGGFFTTLIGLGHSLWLFGFLQTFANVGYFFLAGMPVNVPAMYTATGLEMFTSGMGTGAFSVLLLRLTQKRFSATQYALLSSLFGLPRLIAGPLSGFLVDAVGWRTFFLLTLVFGLPGMVLLARFVPLGVRDPVFAVEPPRRREPLAAGQLVGRGVAGALVGAAGAALLVATTLASKAMREHEGVGFHLGRALASLRHPVGGDWLWLAGIVAGGLLAGLFTAAAVAARHGAGQDLAVDDDGS